MSFHFPSAISLFFLQLYLIPNIRLGVRVGVSFIAWDLMFIFERIFHSNDRLGRGKLCFVSYRKKLKILECRFFSHCLFKTVSFETNISFSFFVKEY